MNSYIRTQDHLTIVFENGDTATVYNNNPDFDQIVEAIREKNWEEVYNLAFPVETLKAQIHKAGGGERVKIVGGIVHLDGKPMHNSLTDRMLSMLSEGFDITPMASFLENLMENPSYRAVNELYDFMEHSNLPITEDGHFIAYKRVDGNYKDIYTGRMDNSVGAMVEMSRNAVDEDKERTCSTGLHFCSREYLSSYGVSSGNRTVIVKINPRDVVSIPADYNNSKGRCCRYEVVGELEHGSEEELEGAYRPLNESHTNEESYIESYDLQSGIVRGTYVSALEAMNKTGIDSSSIRKVCRGERNSAGGLGWREVHQEPSTVEDDWLPEDDMDEYDDPFFEVRW